MTGRRKSLLDPADSRWDREVTIDTGESEPFTYTHFNRDDLHGQMRSLRVLEQLLKRAAAADLPALTWTVSGHAVTGEISLLDGRTPSQRRDAFMAWADSLGAKWSERRPSPGQAELRGWVKVPAPRAPHLEVTVGLAAVWWDEDDLDSAQARLERVKVEYDGIRVDEEGDA
jgi:hypothetical protein